MGWNRSIPDQRDKTYGVISVHAAPAQIDHRDACPPIGDQGNLGSCTGFAGTGALQITHNLQKKKTVPYSPLFLYYQERYIEHTIPYDNGATIRDCFKALHKYGCATETLWPYDINKFTHKPPAQVEKEAKTDLIKQYLSVGQTLDEIKAPLINNLVVVIGFSVYVSFKSEAVAQTGIVPMPTLSESLLGGHAVVVVGYDDSRQWFIVRNSWGPSWGDKGYFYLPYQYLSNPNLASDFWTIEVVI